MTNSGLSCFTTSDRWWVCYSVCIISAILFRNTESPSNCLRKFNLYFLSSKMCFQRLPRYSVFLYFRIWRSTSVARSLCTYNSGFSAHFHLMLWGLYGGARPVTLVVSGRLWNYTWLHYLHSHLHKLIGENYTGNPLTIMFLYFVCNSVFVLCITLRFVFLSFRAGEGTLWISALGTADS